MPIKIDSDSVSRAYAATPLIETGRVFLPGSETWFADYVDSMANFPSEAHDDDVDGTTPADRAHRLVNARYARVARGQAKVGL